MQFKNFLTYKNSINFYLKEKPRKNLEPLEIIFNNSLPHLAIFYYWFENHVKINSTEKIQLKILPDEYFSSLQFFGYSKTHSSKLKKACIYLVEKVYKKPCQIKRGREGLEIHGITLK